MWNRNVAERQVEFCIAQAKRQLRFGGRVLFEHPWSSGLWTHPPMAKLLKSMHLCKASMCAYGLKNPDNGLPILKPTGLAVSRGDMVGCEYMVLDRRASSRCMLGLGRCAPLFGKIVHWMMLL